MESLIQDLRYAIRSLRKSPGFTIAAIAILGLGIGANATIFSLVNAILIRRPAGVQDPGGLVALYTSDFSGPRFGGSSYADFLDMRKQTDAFTGLLAYAFRPVSLSTGTSTERGVSEVTTANYFSLLGLRPALGRTFLAAEDTPGSAPVTVISYGLWERSYGRDSTAIGRVLRLGGQPFTIIGVAPRGFEGLLRGFGPDVWVPAGAYSRISLFDPSGRGNRGLLVVGRLAPGKRLADARAQLEVVAQRLHQAYPQNWTDVKDRARVVTVIPESEARLFPQIRGAVVGFMALLIVVVGLVLLIACANVANLLLAKAAARRKEMAIRLSLGAARGRLVRQLLTESVVLGLAAGAAGLTLAAWVSGFVSGFRPPVPLPIALSVSLDTRVVGFTVAVSLLTAIAFGLAPALQLAQPRLASALKDDVGSAPGRRRHRLRDTLVVVQMAVSLILLVGGGLLIRALRSGQSIDPGIDTEHALMMSVDLGLQGYDETRGRAFYQQILKKVRALPGVEAAALGSQVPLNPFGSERRRTAIQGYAQQQGEDLEFNDNFVTPDYVRALGVEVVRGRAFTEADGPGAPGVAMVNETFARRFWPGADPIGQRLSVSGNDGPWLDIVGVVRDGKYVTLGEDATPYFLLPLAQQYEGGTTLFVRTGGDPASLLSPVREAVRALDRDLPVFDIRTLRDHVSASLLPQQVAATLLGCFGALALLLAALGIYSVVAYSVSQRTREIGIRVALGASRDEVVKLVLRQGMVLVAVGGTIGLVAAGGVSHLIRSLLYGVSALDPLTFIGMSLLLFAAALLACYLPARRAAKVDPVEALRSE